MENSTSSSPHDCNNTNDVLECWYSYKTLAFPAAVGMVNFLLGLPLNVWVLWLSARGSAGGIVALDILVLNTAIIEVLISMITPLIALTSYIGNKKFRFSVLFLCMFFLVVRSLFQSASCVERYLAVVYPIAFLKTRTPKYLMYKVICSGATWLVTLGFCGYVLKFFPAFPSEMLCAPFITVLVSASFCSFFIIRALRRPGPGDGKREGMHKTNIKALRRVGIYLLLLMISCLPIVSMGILKPFLPCNTFCVGYNVAFAIILGSCTGQPMILLYRAGKLPHPRCHSTSLIQLA